MERLQKFIVLMGFILLLSHSGYAQITIGSAEEPLEGALLDLKENKNEAERGLLLPRVKLQAINSLAMKEGDDRTFDEAAHTGLTVYNLTEEGDLCPGIYVWTGDKWMPFVENKIEYFEDVRTLPNGQKKRIVYPMRQFGKAGVWMIQNLRATTYADNLGVDKNTNDLIEKASAITGEKSYYYPNVDATILDSNPEYGLLYTWDAATNGKTPANDGEAMSHDTTDPNPDAEQIGVQGVCPEGWHLPSDKEWNDLEEAIANEQTGLYTIDGFKPKSWETIWRYVSNYIGLAQLRDGANHHLSMISSSPEPVFGKTSKGKSKLLCNGGGFNALMLGYLLSNGISTSASTRSFFWTSSCKRELSYSSAWYRGIISPNESRDKIFRHVTDKSAKLSVRCKRND